MTRSAPTSKGIVVPILVIVIGLGWLLTNLNILPGVNWVWTGGLAVAGLLTIALSGLDRFSFVAGPFLILASIASVLRQTGRLSADLEIPALCIALGVLWFLAVTLPIRNPSWMSSDPNAKK